MIDRDVVARPGNEIRGRNHAVGTEPLVAGGVVGEVVGIEGLIQGGVLEGDAANDNVHAHRQIQDLRIHLQIGLQQLRAVGKGLDGANVFVGLGLEGKFVHLLLRQDRASGAAEAGLQDERTGFQRLEVEAHAAGRGLLNADFEQRGVVGREVNVASRAVDQHFLLAAEADLAGDGALQLDLRHRDN